MTTFLIFIMLFLLTLIVIVIIHSIKKNKHKTIVKSNKVEATKAIQKEDNLIIPTKNKFLYPTDNFGKMEEGRQL